MNLKNIATQTIAVSLLIANAMPAFAYNDRYMFAGSTSVSAPELTSIGREGVRKKALSNCQNSGGNLIRDISWSYGWQVVYSYQCFKRT